MPDVAELFEQAFSFHQAGDPGRAEPLYQAVLARDRTHAEALLYLGVLRLEARDYEQAARLITKSLRHQPGAAVAHANLGVTLQAMGRLDDARSSYARAIELAPDSHLVAERLGDVSLALGRSDEALAAYARAIAIAPSSVELKLKRAHVLQNTGRFQDALDVYVEILNAGSGAPPVLTNVGVCLAALRRFEDAVGFYDQAIAAAPDLVEAHFNRGNAMRRLGRPDEMLNSYERAIARRPDYAEAWCNRGTALRDLNRYAEAFDSFRRALELRPDMPLAANNIASLLMNFGRIDEAETRYRQALALREDAETRSNLLFTLSFSERLSPDDLYRAHLDFNERHIAPLRPRRRPHAVTRDAGRKLRVGYVSPNFNRHPGGHFLTPIFRNFDRAHFDLIAYHTSMISDDVTAALRALATEWRDCVSSDDEALAELIRSDRIDILVDCAGHMGGNSLTMFGLKPAPVQVSFPLYPSTTGIETIDYRIMDPYFAPPAADRFHSERLLRLPDCHVCYAPVPERFDPPAEPPAAANGYVTFGCFNNFAKLGVRTLAAWARILNEHPTARLLLKWQDAHSSAVDWVSEQFAQLGMDPSQIERVGLTAHPYEAYRRIDVCLDSLFANGGTTTCDALWMGVPVVTLAGAEVPFSRVGLCHLTNVGLTELIAGDADDYVAIAGRMADDVEYLRRVRANLRARFAASPLMDGARYVRNLEEAYRQIWANYCRN